MMYSFLTLSVMVCVVENPHQVKNGKLIIINFCICWLWVITRYSGKNILTVNDKIVMMEFNSFYTEVVLQRG